MIRSRRSRLAAAVAVVFPAAALMMGSAQTASAALGDLSCTVTSVVTFDPGLTLEPQEQEITFDVRYSGCTSLTGSPVHSGSHFGTFTDVRSCLAVPGPAVQQITVDWSSGLDSHITATGQSVDVGGQVVHTFRGEVDSGQFSGDTFVEVIAQSSLDAAKCAGSGVTTQSGAGTVTLA